LFVLKTTPRAREQMLSAGTSINSISAT